MTAHGLFRIAPAAVFAALAAPLAAQEQEPDALAAIPVPPIVVTVSRVETDASRAASAITVVTREEIERRQLVTVQEALRNVPGVSLVRTGGPGGSTSVFLRGAGSGHALVLIDGIEMNDPSSPTGGYDLATLGTEAVERIEILRGPQSTIHGSSALGGVVNVITRSGEGPPRIEARGEVGGYGTAAGALAFVGSRGGWSWAATIARRQSDGFSAAPEDLGNDEADGSETTALGLRVERQLGILGLLFVGHMDDSDTDLDAFGPQGDDPNRRLSDREIAGKAEAGIGRQGDPWRSTLSIGFASHDRATRDDVDLAHAMETERGEFDGREWKLAWVNDLALGQTMRVVAGAETERERAETTFRSEGPFGPFESEFPERSARTSGLFGELQADVAEPWSLSLGGRIDDHDRFGSAVTTRIASAVRIAATGSKLRATWGTGFKAPTMFQLFDPEFGSADLDPERSRGWDVGIEQELASGRARIAATWFDTGFEDLIAFAAEGYRNESEVSTHGLEASAAALLGRGVQLATSYTFTHAESERGPDAGFPLIRRPRHRGSLDLSWSATRGPEVVLGVLWVGNRDDLDFAVFPSERVTLDAYTLTRVAASWDVTEAVRVFGRIENLFDSEYEEVLDFGTAGRSAHLGVSFRPWNPEQGEAAR
ncbi:TonB-dependent receptor [soil metagenome]